MVSPSVLFVACSLGMLGQNSIQKIEKGEISSQVIINLHSYIKGDGASLCRWKEQWLSGTGRLSAVQVIGATHIWALDHQGNIHKTINSGETWQAIAIKKMPDAEITSFFFVNQSIGWVSVTKTPEDSLNIQGVESWLLYTNDGGLSWQQQYSGRAIELNRVSFINAQEGWAIGSRLVERETLQNDYLVVHTTDQGKHWLDVSRELNREGGGGFVKDIYSAESSKALLLTSGKKIFSTSNDGQNWQQIGAIPDEAPQTSMFRISRLSTNRIWVLGGTGSREGTWATLALKGDNDNWIKYKTDGVILRDAVFLSDSQVIACGVIASNDTLPLPDDNGREGVILSSSDGGRTWSVVYRTPQAKSINALTVNASKQVWAVGDNGLVLRLDSPSEK
jgi:photosystem II stability/assembly factor-like uncharacterized protein